LASTQDCGGSSLFLTAVVARLRVRRTGMAGPYETEATLMKLLPSPKPACAPPGPQWAEVRFPVKAHPPHAQSLHSGLAPPQASRASGTIFDFPGTGNCVGASAARKAPRVTVHRKGLRSYW